MNEPRPGRIARAVTLLITWAIKLVGLAAAVKELLLTGTPQALPLAVSAFMMAGAQFSEGLVLALLDRLVISPAERDQALKGRRGGDG